MQVTAYNPLEPSLEGTFHPAGWSSFPPRPAQRHSYVAKKSLAAGTACHEEQLCTQCHSRHDGAPSTHPRGWGTSSVMRRLKRNNLDTCLKCHVQEDPNDPINRP